MPLEKPSPVLAFGRGFFEETVKDANHEMRGEEGDSERKMGVGHRTEL